MKVTRAHGTGGRSSQEIIDTIFLPQLKNEFLALTDGVKLPFDSSELIVTTDAHVVEPIFFPGGDIGKLAVTGVINDLLTCGGRPRYLSATFILEEGFEIAELRRTVSGIAGEHGLAPIAAGTC